MSSLSKDDSNEQLRIAHVGIGEGRDPAMDSLASPKSDIILLAGAKGDGRRILQLIATYDRIIYWPFTQEVRA